MAGIEIVVILVKQDRKEIAIVLIGSSAHFRAKRLKLPCPRVVFIGNEEAANFARSPMRICNGNQNSCCCKDVGLPVVQLALKIWQVEDTTALCAQRGEIFHTQDWNICPFAAQVLSVTCALSSQPFHGSSTEMLSQSHRPPLKYWAVIRHGTEWRRGRGERRGGKRSVRDEHNKAWKARK